MVFGVGLLLSVGRVKALAFTSIGHFVNDGSSILLPLVVDLLASLRGVTPLEVSVLLFVYPLSSAPFSVLVGRQADRTGAPGALMAVGIACMGSGLVGFYLVMSYATGAMMFALALACDLVMGFGSSFYHPLGASILQATFRKGTTGRALGLNGSMGSLGRALYPVLFAAAALFNATGSFGLLGLVGFGAAILIWTGLGRVAFPIHHDGGRHLSIRKTLTRPMILLLVVTFVRSAALGGIIYYVPIFLTVQRGFGVGPLLGVAIAATYATAIVGQPFFGFLIDKLDHRVVLAISALGAAGSIAGAVSFGGIVSVGMLSLFGFFTYTGFPLLMALASDYSERTGSALGNSLIWGLGDSTGSSLGPLLVFVLMMNSYANLGRAFEVMGVIVAISAVAGLLLPEAVSKSAAADDR